MTTERRFRWAPVVLVVLPLWLIVSAAAGIWLLFRHEAKEAEKETARFAKSVSEPALADDLRKIIDVVGERHGSSETAAANLGRVVSMIEGSLGPSNIGYNVIRHRGPTQWPLLQVTIRGTSDQEPVWIITSCDSRAGSRGSEANATGLAATLAAARALASDKPTKPIHFIFLPHANDSDSPVVETATVFAKLALSPKPSSILVVEAMGGGQELWLTSRDTTARPLDFISGLGKVVGAEVACLGEDSDLASVLFEMGLPAVRVATRPILLPDEKDDNEPFAPTVATSSGRLVELIRRLSK